MADGIRPYRAPDAPIARRVDRFANLPPEVPRASPRVAAVLSLLVPGWGHFYARRFLRGLAWVGVGLLGLGLFGAVMRVAGPAIVLVISIAGLGLLGLRIGAAVDAHGVARRYPSPRLARGGSTLALLFLIAVSYVERNLAFGLLVKAFKIPSASMIPTLVVGDHVYVDPLRTAKQGDLVVFPFPEHPEQEFIKRIVGLPGDRIVFHGGHPNINGVDVRSCTVGEAWYDEDEGHVRHPGHVYLEALGSKRYLTFYDDREGAAFPEVQGPYFVRDGEVFVVGDNRFNSHDSRMWNGGQGGGVPIATLRGVPYVVWLTTGKQAPSALARTGLDLGEPHLPPWMAGLRPGLDRCLKSLPVPPK
jgi:signal peptidase I